MMRLKGNDGTSIAMEKVHSSCVQKHLAISLAVTLDKIRDTAGRDTVDEVSKISIDKISVWQCSTDW